MMKTVKFLLLFFLVFLFHSLKNVEAAYFYVKEGAEKCFVESVAQNVVLTTAYDNFGLQDVICFINIKNNNGKTLFSHDTSKLSKGKVSYLSTYDGLYYICISCPSTNWFKSSTIKWNLSVEVGGSDIDLKNVAKKSELGETLNVLSNLKKKFKSMKFQQTYQKKLATDMYEYNETVYDKMLYCCLIEIFLLIFITIYSIIHLKHYFKSQKLM